MLFKNIAAIAAVSVIADGFLLPPKISKADFDIINDLPFEFTAESVAKIVDLKCSGCPVPVVNLDGTTVALQHVDSILELNYTVEHNRNVADRLLLNGVSIFPTNMASIEPFKASQKFSKDQPFQTQENVRLGYEMSLRTVKKDRGGFELFAINIHVFEVADKFVNDIDSVELLFIKDPSENLFITAYEKKKATSPTELTTGDKDCTSMLCKWQAIIAAKLANLKPLKGCGSKGKGSKTGAVAGHHKGQGRPHPHGGRPHHGKHHGGHRHHQKGFVRFMRMLRNVTIHILIPVFIGVVAGLTASVIGMVFGQLVVFAWRTIRGGSQPYSRVEQDDIDDDDDEESKILIIEPQGPPPVYEDIIVVKEAADEKNEPEV